MSEVPASEGRTSRAAETCASARVLLGSMAALVGVVGGCRGGHVPEDRPPVEPGMRPIAAAGGAPASASGEADATASANPAIPALTPAMRGLPKVALTLDDPRLALVREQEQAHDFSSAARTLDAVRLQATLDPAQACAWSYLSGKLHLAAGETTEAVTAFERVTLAAGDAGPPCVLAGYAALHDAQTLARIGRYDEVLARAALVGDDFAAREELALVRADAYAGKGERAAAVPLWRALLAANPRGLRWADTAVQLATALLDGVDGPAEAHADEAFDLATRVQVEAPWVAERVDLTGMRARASLLLPRPRPTVLTPEERQQQVQAWFDAGLQRRAVEAADALLKTLPRGGKEHAKAACKTAILRAQARPRGRAEEAAEAWGAAISRCEGDEALVTALYYGAKASASAHHPAEALERFARVEKLFPKHRLADDACYRAAVLACDEGDEARGLSRLSSLPDTYPEGDMGGEALFRVALTKLARRDLAGAREALDRMLSAGLDGGRIAPGRGAYFRARVAELTGESADARARYSAIVREQPLDYYMLLAYARLRAMDGESAARAVLEEAAAEEPDGPFLTREHPELASPAFERFVRLLEAGEVDSARREAHASGLVAEDVDPEVLWTVAWVYERAGVPELGHSFSRTRLADYREHWPSGRWRFAWEVAFPRVWEPLVAKNSELNQIPVPLTWAIMREESAFNPDARSVADAIGLMQLIGPTARATARGTILPFDEDSLRRPEVSIALGTRLLSTLRAAFSSNPSLAIAAYNGGSRAVRRWLGERGFEDFDLFVEHIPYDETRAYLKRVLASQAAYAYLYAPKALGEVLSIPMHPIPEPTGPVATP
ncbi:MAG: lytic transglycosylase domain-containing protein [Myxococcales bacterium]|nr:lytic transglycosylase domain-containing protein [Myxococcales bacterium]